MVVAYVDGSFGTVSWVELSSPQLGLGVLELGLELALELGLLELGLELALELALELVGLVWKLVLGLPGD